MRTKTRSFVIVCSVVGVALGVLTFVALRKPLTVWYYRRDLASTDPAIVSNAVTRLCDLRAASAVPDIVDLIQREESQYPDVHDDHFAIQHLARIGPAAIPYLMRYLNSQNEFIRINVVKVIARSHQMLDDPELPAELARLLWDSNGRSSAGYLLELVDATRATNTIGQALDDSDPEVRSAALSVISSCQPLALEFRDRISELLSSPDAYVRECALRAATAIPNDDEIVRLIIDRLEDPADQVFDMAVYALEAMKATQALESLARTLEEYPGRDVGRAMVAIPGGITKLAQLLPRVSSDEARIEILAALTSGAASQLGPIVPAVVVLLRSSSSEIRAEAARVLAHAGPLARGAAAELRVSLAAESTPDCADAMRAALSAVESR